MENMKIQASKEDRERLFKVLDVYLITNNRGLTDAQIIEVDECRESWRDMTTIKGYPNIDFPLPVPSWINNPHFASSWKKETIC